ncbi:neutral zinc metallopeptidase [Nocardia sp. NPDC004604]|uniref:neutral zinc metallopeptidase n=1 Tax=Nocardia sp. NPDC004604 TaxID=3157013 RepID=UPI0033B39D47
MNARTLRRGLLGTLIAVTVLALVAGCGDDPAAPARVGYDATEVAGLTVADGPSGLREHVPPPAITVDGFTGTPVDLLAADAVADVEDYWRVQYPKIFGRQFIPVDHHVSYDSDDAAASVCGESVTGMPNAFYTSDCKQGRLIAWDRGLISMYARLGEETVPYILAHEYGHAIQDQARLVNNSTTTVVREQQADCFAGVYLRSVAEGKSARFALNTADGLNRVVAAAMSLRDGYYIGTMPSEHGNGFERASALELGITDGADACSRIDDAEIAARRGNLPAIFSSTETGEQEITRDSVQAQIDFVTQLFKLKDKPKVEYTGAIRGCPDAHETTPVSYCPSTNTIGIDLPGLVKRGRKVDSLVPSGDFDAYALVVSRVLLPVEKASGRSLSEQSTALHVACYTGVYTDALATGEQPESALSQGDVDEALAGLLRDGLVASNVDGLSVPSGFARIEAYQLGLKHGRTACDNTYTDAS